MSQVTVYGRFLLWNFSCSPLVLYFQDKCGIISITDYLKMYRRKSENLMRGNINGYYQRSD